MKAVSRAAYMGMKTDVKTRVEIREGAIAIGSRIIREEGFREFSLRRVAREIGYTVGSLYHVFAHQDDFLLQIKARTLDELYNVLSVKLRADQSSGIDRLKIIAHSYLEFAQQNYKLWCFIFDNSLVVTDVTPSWYMERVNKLFSIIEETLIAAKLHTVGDVRAHVCTLWSGVHGICTLALSGKLSPAWTGSNLLLINNLIDNYISGLRK